MAQSPRHGTNSQLKPAGAQHNEGVPIGQIAILEDELVDQAVELHARLLTRRLKGEPGKRLLRMYYAELSADNGIGLCLALREENRLRGMVVLRWGGNRLLWTLLKKRPAELLSLLAWHTVRHPITVLAMGRQLWERKPLNGLFHKAGNPTSWCILHALVANPSGEGIGSALTSAAIEKARSLGFEYMFTPTYAGNKANRLFEAAGFKHLLTTAEGRDNVNWYGRGLERAKEA